MNLLFVFILLSSGFFVACKSDKRQKIEKIIGGEQAIDVANTIMTLEKFYALSKIRNTNKR